MPKWVPRPRLSQVKVNSRQTGLGESAIHIRPELDASKTLGHTGPNDPIRPEILRFPSGVPDIN
jgi:hypothetical protein